MNFKIIMQNEKRQKEHILYNPFIQNSGKCKLINSNREADQLWPGKGLRKFWE